MITTLTGANWFSIQKELANRLTDFIAQHSDFGLEKYDGEEVDYDRMREALESLPLLADRKLVVLRSPGANKTFLEKAESLLLGIPESTDVIIVEPKLDKRSSYYKFLHQNTDYKDFPELDEFGLTSWLSGEAKAAGGSLAPADARFLIGRVGARQLLLSNELHKLIAYQPAITRETIELLTEPTPQSTVFELLDAVFAGKAARALQLYQEQRAARVEPQQILAMVAWQLHVLALVKTAGERDVAAIAKEAKLNPYVVRKSSGVARHLTLASLKKLVHDALQLDIRLKSEAIDADDALQHLLLSIMQ